MGHMKKILIASFDMEIGGVERSLISMLEHIDYSKYSVDLLLYKHQGDYMKMIPPQVNILDEIPQYASFRMSIKEVLFNKQLMIGCSRLYSKLWTSLISKMKGIEEPGYMQMQLMWKYALPFLPSLQKTYDVAISYLWPHYFVAEKVNAKKKLAWVHTDYSKIQTNKVLDLKMWNKFDHIVAVSDACKASFLHKYNELNEKVCVMENILSPEEIRKLATERVYNPMDFDHRFKLMTVARLSYAKGIDTAIKAMYELKEKGYDQLVWYVVGFGGDEDHLNELISIYNLEDHFILLGKKTNPYPYIKQCDLYVQPSRYEGKAVTVTEAKILGKPVLITNYSTATSQVNNWVDGLIIPQSVQGIVEGIEMMYKNSGVREKLADNCNKTNYYNYEAMEVLYNLFEDEPKHIKEVV